MCSCARTSRKGVAFRGATRPVLPVPVSSGTRPVNDSRTRTRLARTSCCRYPSNRTGVISTTALFVSPWNTVPPRRATYCGRYPRDRRGAATSRRPGRTVPSHETRHLRDTHRRGAKPLEPAQVQRLRRDEAHLLPDHRLHQRPTQRQRRGRSLPRRVEARHEHPHRPRRLHGAPRSLPSAARASLPARRARGPRTTPRPGPVLRTLDDTRRPRAERRENPRTGTSCSSDRHRLPNHRRSLRPARRHRLPEGAEPAPRPASPTPDRGTSTPTPCPRPRAGRSTSPRSRDPCPSTSTTGRSETSRGPG